MFEQFLSQVKHIRHSQEADDLMHYGKDWTTQFSPAPSIVLFPKSTEEVQEIVQIANETKTHLVPSGGRTGLSGGAVSEKGEAIISMEGMQRILHFDPLAATIRVEAGYILEHLQDFARSNDLYYPIDLGAKGSCTLGGNAATNAGGIHVLRYGSTRNQIRGLKVVSGQGDILALNHGLVKNATGPSLMHAFIGSEGIFGMITELELQLQAVPTKGPSILLGLPNLNSALAVWQSVRKNLSLMAFEFFDQHCLQFVCQHHSLKAPFQNTSPYYLLLEIEGSDVKVLEKQLISLYEQGYIENDLIAETEKEKQGIWKYREGITESIQGQKPYKNDISVRPAQVPELIGQLNQILAEQFSGLRCLYFGHLGDGNIHINLLKPEQIDMAEFKKISERFSHLLYPLLREMNGSISAEHGIGLLKKNYLSYSLSSEEISYLRQLKTVFDPQGIMNPGKLLPDY